MESFEVFSLIYLFFALSIFSSVVNGVYGVSPLSTTAEDELTPRFEGNIPKNAIRSFSPGGQYIVLTFSGGPHHEITPEILKILSNYSVKATFFVSGQKVIYFPEILQSILSPFSTSSSSVDIGGGKTKQHDLGHQGFYSISQLNKRTTEEIAEQVARTEILLKNETRKVVKGKEKGEKDILYFRPPGLIISQSLSDWIANEKRIKTILWKVDMNRMISNPHITSSEIKEAVKRRVQPGDIINCYDNKITLKYLPAMIEGLKEMKYEFLTLTEILTFPDDSPH
jgi:peptidoglycan/xylan/chitin deacetylase (PgdA/CDA1 family)